MSAEPGFDPALLESLLNDFKNLSAETRKKYPQLKEACEEASIKIRQFLTNPQVSVFYLVNQIIYPLAQGCESKDLKIIKGCLKTIQHLITSKVVDEKCARTIVNTMWILMESGTEEVKLLQSATLLLTTNTVVQGDILAKTLVMCLRLHFAKNSTTINTAGATVRQLVSLVFERVMAEEQNDNKGKGERFVDLEELKIPSATAPKALSPCAADAYLLFQDLVQLVNADQPFWLLGMTEMTRTFGLELLELVLTNFSQVFFKNAEFSFLLKERVCALVIKLFSPNIKFRNVTSSTAQQGTQFDKPYFPVSMRLLRVVSVLIQKYHSLLITECEIFLSLIVKFMDPDKPMWQRSLALEVVHKMTIQPELLNSFCECYDLKKHTTNIFQDIVNSLGAYVQSLFIISQMQNSSAGPIQGQLPGFMGNSGPGSAAGFFSRGIWLPVIVSFSTGQTKAVYLEMLDKTEPPPILDGYGISVAYACLIEVIRSLSITIRGVQTVGEAQEELKQETLSEERKRLYCQLINSSWCGLLAALSPLVEASTDESITENILKALQTYASLCGALDQQLAQDAFITAICKSSLPPHYAMTVLSSSGNNNKTGHTRSDSQDMNAQYMQSCFGDADYRAQVVAVGTPLPTSSVPLGAQQGPVMLTAKNLQAMRALLNLAHCHGSVLGPSWHLVLTTLQHLVWILGLKPSTGGSLKAGRNSTDTNTVITTAVMADLPVLSVMLSKLFESSQQLDDVALHHLINALCKLSQEAMELAYSNREPSLFAVAKLLETGLVNMFRIEVLWRPLTNHLLEVCHHPHIRMREWGVEAVTYLVKAALQYKYPTPLKENHKLQTLLLGPLAELSSIPHGDVRQRQLECVLQILHGAGETLSHGWPSVLGIIGAVSDHHGENLIRVAFQCLQLVITDFLPIMPWRCLPLCVDTVSKFGLQTQELNISLTAVGLMWNISDYFFQNQNKLSQIYNDDAALFPDFPGTVNMRNFDKLWMCLFVKLGDLCVDSRPAVRKSAGQTLFSTISAHGSLLEQTTWQAVLRQVLFPLLDRVRSASSSASSEKMDTSGNILIHHTRNTAQKQWAETQVLTLSGVARVFNTKRQLLQALGDFPRAWSLLLEFIEGAALSRNNEVSFAALRSFQEVLLLNKQDGEEEAAAVGSEEGWLVAWKVWLNIGTAISVEKDGPDNSSNPYYPSQAYLSALVQIFPHIFCHIRSTFDLKNLKQLCQVLTNIVSVPVQPDTTPYILSTGTTTTTAITSESSLTSVHDGALHSMEMLQREFLQQKNFVMVPEVFRQLLNFAGCACRPPGKGEGRAAAPEWITLNFVPFGERAMASAVALYEKTSEKDEIVEGGVLRDIIGGLRLALALKYDCPSSSTWKAFAAHLVTVLKTGIPVARARPTPFAPMWAELAGTLNDFLFPKSTPPPDRGLDELVTDEATDCQIIELLKTEILPYSSVIPRQFIFDIVLLLNKGSIHSATSTTCPDAESEMALREEFAKTCFETLLQFSLNNGEHEALVLDGEGGIAGKLAITALLHRFQEVLKNYIEDEKLSGKCPLPRYRLSEISFVLKAVTTLVISMKEAHVDDPTTWEQLIGLYPYLVECTTTSWPHVSRPLREALLQYRELLQPPGNHRLHLQNGVQEAQR